MPNETILLNRGRVNLQQLQSQQAVTKTARPEEEQSVEHTSSDYELVRNEVRNFLMNEHNKLVQDALFNKKRKPEVERIIRNYLQIERKFVAGMSIDDVVIRIWKDIFSLGPLDDALEDNSITEIMINGYDQPWVKQNGKDRPAEDLIQFDNQKHLETIIVTKILNSCGKSVSDKNPIVDARIGECRVNVVWQPISQMKGPILTIRKFPPITLTEKEFLEKGTASPEMFEFIKLIVEGGCSICMGGSTGSGKTTTFKLMAGFIKKGERVIVIEDTAEMRLEKLYPYEEGYHFISEECRIMEDESLDVVIQKLVVTSLRQTPKRLIIGEIRKEKDLLAAIEAALIGHPLWFTMHGLSASELAERISMLLARFMTKQDANRLLSKSLNIIMMQKHFAEDDRRRVFEIVEIVGVDKDGELHLNPIFEFDWENKEFVRSNPISERLVKMFQHAEIPRTRYEKYLHPVG
ncbi:pilus assembly protein CpaF [Brevibacillus aydinogluensis]|jgi:pilus assembly protein CpaF|uniref:CpaF family protein n=1 Tax=Brevibacillus aydinogluensis TaxID=927786 RepID=UPI00289325C3|nr:ATPase, T2SS/T4P/T4SS family [Brevibacillus aydinogluensis]MDT3417445.1 pilus assembly protein CpaF [Brevibacillus aydinogluensis]